MTVTGLTSDLLILATGDMTLDADANYDVNDINANWDSSTVGAGGKYCSVGDIDGDNNTKDEDCYFPCFINPPGGH